MDSSKLFCGSTVTNLRFGRRTRVSHARSFNTTALSSWNGFIRPVPNERKNLDQIEINPVEAGTPLERRTSLPLETPRRFHYIGSSQAWAGTTARYVALSIFGQIKFDSAITEALTPNRHSSTHPTYVQSCRTNPAWIETLAGWLKSGATELVFPCYEKLDSDQIQVVQKRLRVYSPDLVGSNQPGPLQPVQQENGCISTTMICGLWYVPQNGMLWTTMVSCLWKAKCTLNLFRNTCQPCQGIMNCISYPMWHKLLWLLHYIRLAEERATTPIFKMTFAMAVPLPSCLKSLRPALLRRRCATLNVACSQRFHSCFNCIRFAPLIYVEKILFLTTPVCIKLYNDAK